MISRYTVKEIDSLRTLSENKIKWGYYNPQQKFIEGSWSGNPTEISEIAEGMVRTFMIAGIRPEDFPDDAPKGR